MSFLTSDRCRKKWAPEQSDALAADYLKIYSLRVQSYRVTARWGESPGIFVAFATWLMWCSIRCVYSDTENEWVSVEALFAKCRNCWKMVVLRDFSRIRHPRALYTLCDYIIIPNTSLWYCDVVRISGFLADKDFTIFSSVGITLPNPSALLLERVSSMKWKFGNGVIPLWRSVRISVTILVYANGRNLSLVRYDCGIGVS